MKIEGKQLGVITCQHVLSPPVPEYRLPRFIPKHGVCLPRALPKLDTKWKTERQGTLPGFVTQRKAVNNKSLYMLLRVRET